MKTKGTSALLKRLIDDYLGTDVFQGTLSAAVISPSYCAKRSIVTFRRQKTVISKQKKENRHNSHSSL